MPTRQYAADKLVVGLASNLTNFKDRVRQWFVTIMSISDVSGCDDAQPVHSGFCHFNVIFGLVCVFFDV